MKIAFFASDAIALGALEMLLNKTKDKSSDCELSCIVSNPDKPKGRGKKVSPNKISAWAIENKIELLRPEKSPSVEEIARMKELGVDCIIVMAYGKILKSEILDYPKLGCLNLHASILPHLRGASPVETAIAIGDKRTGISLMKITPPMDEGPVSDFMEIEISDDDTSQTLREKLCLVAAQVLERNLDAIKKSSLKFEEQDSSRATFARKLSKADAILDFSLSAFELKNRIRAFGFGIFFTSENEAIKIGSADAEELPVNLDSATNSALGTVLSASPKEGLKILCAQNSALSAKTLQRPCMKMIPCEEFLKASSIKAGEILRGQKSTKLLRKNF